MIAEYFPKIKKANEVLYIPRMLVIVASGNNFGVDFGEDLQAFDEFMIKNRTCFKKQGLVRTVEVPASLVNELQECCFSGNGYFVNIIARQIMQSARICRIKCR